METIAGYFALLKSRKLTETSRKFSPTWEYMYEKILFIQLFFWEFPIVSMVRNHIYNICFFCEFSTSLEN